MNLRLRIESLVWLILVAATLLSWWLGHRPADDMAPVSFSLIAGLILVACIKIALVMEHFMELHTAPAALRLVAAAWITALGSGLIWIFSTATGLKT